MGRDSEWYYNNQFSEERGVNILGLLPEAEATSHERNGQALRGRGATATEPTESEQKVTK